MPNGEDYTKNASDPDDQETRVFNSRREIAAYAFVCGFAAAGGILLMDAEGTHSDPVPVGIISGLTVTAGVYMGVQGWRQISKKKSITQTDDVTMMPLAAVGEIPLLEYANDSLSNSYMYDTNFNLITSQLRWDGKRLQ